MRSIIQTFRRGRRSGPAGWTGEPSSPAKGGALLRSRPAQALAWVEAHHLPQGGICVQSGHLAAYPEVTGYLVPTLIRGGSRGLAAELTRWLLCVQRADGSFTDPDEGKAYAFDTGQALRGLLAAEAAELVPHTGESARRAADFLLTYMTPPGSGIFPEAYRGTSCPESVHLYVLPALVEAITVLKDARYRDAAQCGMESYARHPDFLRIGDLTHFLAYELEALIDLGRRDLAELCLDRLRQEQKPDGSVRGAGGVDWVCTPGLAQLAICWYKIGHDEPADAAMAWLDAHQEENGGFRGSFGPGAAYKPDVEISWACKFYLDAHILRRAAFFRRLAGLGADRPPEGGDAWLDALIRLVRSGDKVLEAGAVDGRGISLIRQKVPGIDGAIVRHSPVFCPPRDAGIRVIPGSPDAIDCPDNQFDVVFSTEALPYAVDPGSVIEEMIRVARPGGWILVAGPGDCGEPFPPWAGWVNPVAIGERMSWFCDAVSVQAVSGGWGVVSGRKRSPLCGEQWNKVLISAEEEKHTVEAVRFNRFTDWGRALLLETGFGETVLEIGSGTGQISLQMAQAGRRVTCLDASENSLDFVRRCAGQLGLSVETVCADAAGKLPFPDEKFECVWSSGLLEHFTADERRRLLREWARVCCGKIISLVPNASCLAYRAGKMLKERRGTWPYGLEMPVRSLREDYEAAGIRVVKEFSLGGRHALNFLSKAAPDLSRQLQAIIQTLPDREWTDWNQGYLLMTIGVRREP